MSIKIPFTLQQALSLADFDPVPAMRRMVPSNRSLAIPPKDARLSSVMLLLHEKENEVTLTFVKRPMTLRNHPGQVAFPGGRNDPPETFVETALRETDEEIGVAADQISLIGQMRPVYVPPSNFLIYPYVGWHSGVPQYIPQVSEVDDILEIPLYHFTNEEIRGVTAREHEGRTYNIPHFKWQEHIIWGATATMLSELVARVQAADELNNPPSSPRGFYRH